MQKKINQIKDNNNIQDWDKFVKEVKTVFSNKSKAVDAKWKIKTFRSGKKNIVNFMIKFKALVMKTETDDMYTIFIKEKHQK